MTEESGIYLSHSNLDVLARVSNKSRKMIHLWDDVGYDFRESAHKIEKTCIDFSKRVDAAEPDDFDIHFNRVLNEANIRIQRVYQIIFTQMEVLEETCGDLEKILDDGILYDYLYEKYFPYETRGDQA